MAEQITPKTIPFKSSRVESIIRFAGASGSTPVNPARKRFDSADYELEKINNNTPARLLSPLSQAAQELFKRNNPKANDQ